MTGFYNKLLPTIFFLSAFFLKVNAQNLDYVDTIRKDEAYTHLPYKYGDTVVYSNQAAGESTPGKGVKIMKNDFASLNISIYAMARYLNQMPGTQTWHDNTGAERQFNGRNDFFWHRVMIWFTGFIATPKLTYTATAWTVMTTQQTLVYGNFLYSFNKHFKLGIGIAPNLCLRTLQGPFPFFTSTDRTMAEDAIRGGFTNGAFLKGQVVPKLYYTLMLGNNLSTLGVKAAQLTRHLSSSASIWWMPTTDEFGPRGGNGDFEYHTKMATRFGASFCHSRENRFNNTGTPSPDNTQVRMSDGVLLFETGALAPGVTVIESNFDMLSVDLGFKYKGAALHTEFYYRTLSKFDSDGPIPYKIIRDKGYSVSLMYMLVPRVLCIYGISSGLWDEFKRYPYEIGGGVNIYPKKTRSWRLNAQSMYVYKSAAGGTFGLYTAGQTGATITLGVDILL
jgi:hypothetical protein